MDPTDCLLLSSSHPTVLARKRRYRAILHPENYTKGSKQSVYVYLLSDNRSHQNPEISNHVELQGLGQKAPPRMAQLVGQREGQRCGGRTSVLGSATKDGRRSDIRLPQLTTGWLLDPRP